MLPSTYDLRLTTCYLLLTTYDLRLTTYDLLLATYYVLLTTYALLLTPYYFRLTTYDLLLTAYYLCDAAVVGVLVPDGCQVHVPPAPRLLDDAHLQGSR